MYGTHTSSQTGSFVGIAHNDPALYPRRNTADLIPAQCSTRPRYYFISLDGTLNHRDRSGSALSYATNVQWLHQLVMRTTEDGVPVHKLYLSGVGTGGAERDDSKAALLGAGIKNSIKDAYRWLCDHGVTSSDKIILTGFSRGAHAARVLALLITDLGLVRARFMEHVEIMFEHWINGREEENDQNADAAVFRLRAQYSQCITGPMWVHTCAVFDTVGTMGNPLTFNRHSNKKLGFARKRIGNVTKAYHAVALDEDRKFFPVNLWEDHVPGQEPDRMVRQYWFRGSHSDVGGGENSFLSNLSLVWIISMMESDPELDIMFDNGKLGQMLQANTIGPAVTNSRTGKYRFAGKSTRQPKGQHAERVHVSVRLLQALNMVDPVAEPGEHMNGPWQDTFGWFWGSRPNATVKLRESDHAHYSIHGRDSSYEDHEERYLQTMGLIASAAPAV